MQDFIDRRATAANRAWAIFGGLWLVGLAGQLPIGGLPLAMLGVLFVAAGLGAVELAHHLWTHGLQDVVLGLVVSFAHHRHPATPPADGPSESDPRGLMESSNAPV